MEALTITLHGLLTASVQFNVRKIVFVNLPIACFPHHDLIITLSIFLSIYLIIAKTLLSSMHHLKKLILSHNYFIHFSPHQYFASVTELDITSSGKYHSIYLSILLSPPFRFNRLIIIIIIQCEYSTWP